MNCPSIHFLTISIFSHAVINDCNQVQLDPREEKNTLSHTKYEWFAELNSEPKVHSWMLPASQKDNGFGKKIIHTRDTWVHSEAMCINFSRYRMLVIHPPTHRLSFSSMCLFLVVTGWFDSFVGLSDILNQHSTPTESNRFVVP